MRKRINLNLVIAGLKDGKRSTGSIKKTDLIERLQDYLKNIWTIWRAFNEKYGVDPPIINGDQMPLHRNESSQQKTVTFKGEHIR